MPLIPFSEYVAHTYYLPVLPVDIVQGNISVLLFMLSVSSTTILLYSSLDLQPHLWFSPTFNMRLTRHLFSTNTGTDASVTTHIVRQISHHCIFRHNSGGISSLQ